MRGGGRFKNNGAGRRLHLGGVSSARRAAWLCVGARRGTGWWATRRAGIEADNSRRLSGISHALPRMREPMAKKLGE